MTDQNELKPCPFCGGKPTVLPKNPHDEGDAWTRIQCENKNCGDVAVSAYQDSGHYEAALAKWNTRAETPPGNRAKAVEAFARFKKWLSSSSGANYADLTGGNCVQDLVDIEAALLDETPVVEGLEEAIERMQEYALPQPYGDDRFYSKLEIATLIEDNRAFSTLLKGARLYAQAQKGGRE